MKQIKYTLSKCVIVLLLCMAVDNCLHAQGMEDAKWWMGVKAGVNFARVGVSEKYSVFEYLTASTNSTEKVYGSIFKNAGPSLAFTVAYSITPNISVSVQPGYLSYHFLYTTSYRWKDTLKNENILNNELKTKLHYIELPLLLRYEYSVGKVQPHLQAGAYYGFLLNGKKTSTAEEKFKDAAGESSLGTTIEDYNVNQLYIHSQYGVIGGVGVSVDLNYFRLSLECNYRYGLNNITNRKNRLEQQRMINGSYDVPDDIKLQNLEFSLHCATPLDFLIHTPGMSGKPGKVRRR
jgi:hypothetical protein